jgi:hypothetical protein
MLLGSAYFSECHVTAAYICHKVSRPVHCVISMHVTAARHTTVTYSAIFYVPTAKHVQVAPSSFQELCTTLHATCHSLLEAPYVLLLLLLPVNFTANSAVWSFVALCNIQITVLSNSRAGRWSGNLQRIGGLSKGMYSVWGG